jgi:hypothetical protein
MRLPTCPIILLVCLQVMLTGCNRERLNMEIDHADRVKALTRSLCRTDDAQRAATTHVVDSVRTLDARMAVGADPEATYDMGRRFLATAESRQRIASTRLDLARDQARKLFDEWDEEIDRYEDDALRRASRERWRAVNARYEAARDALAAADERFEPVAVHLSDRLLFAKHHRSDQALPPTPQGVRDPAPEIDNLETATRSASEAVGRFVDGTDPAP